MKSNMETTEFENFKSGEKEILIQTKVNIKSLLNNFDHENAIVDYTKILE